MVVYFHERRETIDLLRRVVDKLDDNNGCISAEDLWDQCVPANVRSSDPTVARHGMRQMEGLLDGLQSFVSTLVSTYISHISTTRLCVRTHHLTVNSLPNEIIHHIVKDAFDYENVYMLMNYTHISSKFRSVILNSPSLWASICLNIYQPANILSTILHRSAALGLIVDLSITGEESEPRFSTVLKNSANASSALSKLSAIFEHQHRWRTVRLIPHNSENYIQANLPRPNLTSVRILEVQDEGWETPAIFFQNWDIPRLEELHWKSQCIPPPSGMATQMLHNCSIALGRPASNSMSSVEFLNAASRLRTLKLNLNFSNDDEHTEVQETRLPCLEYLTITFAPEIGPTAILLKSILCPGLKHLSIQASTQAEYSDLTENMRERYPMLTAFTVVPMNQCFASEYPKEDIFFDVIMSPLPNTIKNLKIKRSYGAGLKFRESRRDDSLPQNSCISYPNLTELDLEGCTIQDDSFCNNLSEILRHYRVSLNYFRLGAGRGMNKIKTGLEEKNAIMTLQRAGVLVATS